MAKAEKQRLKLKYTEDRLAILILYAHPHNPYTRLAMLKRSLQYIKDNILQHTPSDVFLFYREPFLKDNDKHSLIDSAGSWLHLIEAPRWALSPPHYLDHEVELFATNPGPAANRTVMNSVRTFYNPKSGVPWTSRENIHFRNMGNFFTRFGFQYAHLLGYQYAMKLDDDFDVTSKVDFNIVEYAREKHIDFGYRFVLESTSSSHRV